MNIFKTVKKGIIDDNPVFVQLIGMCPTLGVTTNAINGLSMGLATALVLIGSNLVISLLKKVIPDEIRIPAFVVIISTFVTAIGMLLEAYLPEVNKTLGLYIPLIVVNCLILARAESFAFKNNPVSSAFDGLGMGLGFTLGLTILGAVREILGSGQIFGKLILGASYKPALIFILPPGAFIVLGLLIAGINKYSNNKKKAESN